MKKLDSKNTVIFHFCNWDNATTILSNKAAALSAAPNFVLRALLTFEKSKKLNLSSKIQFALIGVKNQIGFLLELNFTTKIAISFCKLLYNSKQFSHMIKIIGYELIKLDS